MTANPIPGGIVAEPLPVLRSRPTLDVDGARATILAEARVDAGTAVGLLNRLLLEAILDVEGHGSAGLSFWSIPARYGSPALSGSIQDGNLIIEGRQHLRDLRSGGASALAIVRDRDPALGGYIARIEGKAIVKGEPIFGREGFRESFIDAPEGHGVLAFQAVGKQALDIVLDLLPVLEDYLHAVVDLGILKAFFEIAHEHVTKRTRPWQGQSLAKATDDPHLVRRYGEYHTTLSALDVLVEEATVSLKTGSAERAIGAVAAARGYATLAGQSIINGTLELLGAGATSQRFGFDRYWSDFTAHAVAHQSLRSFEAVGRAYVRATSGE